MQIVGILGLISLLTLNNAHWIAGLLLAAIRIPDFLTPLRDIAQAVRERPEPVAPPPREPPEPSSQQADAEV
jgi:hypothetical protein